MRLKCDRSSAPRRRAIREAAARPVFVAQGEPHAFGRFSSAKRSKLWPAAWRDDEETAMATLDAFDLMCISSAARASSGARIHLLFTTMTA
jgi:hypothetical protein